MKPHLHFMGIGGVSMSGLARWYKEDGYKVSGCDSQEGKITKHLRSDGFDIEIGHSPDHVDSVDVLISSKAIHDSHPEILAAHEHGLHVLKRIELLAELFKKRKTIGVTGTHGKSTTTGMIASIFLACERDPSIQIGGHLPAIDNNAHYGTGEDLIAEVDESDPGFAQLETHIAVITNLEDDHVAGDYNERRNYHANLADLEQAMSRFAQHAQHVIYCRDWPSLQPIVGNLPQAISYGTNEHADYQIQHLHLEADKSTFQLKTPNDDVVHVEIFVPGTYNVQNATAALISAHLSGLDLKLAAKALSTFSGIGRRWQRWGKVCGALIIDDYAHHPTEITATLTAAKHTGKRVRAVLQPHRWIRTARHWPALADAAALADEVLVLDIYAAGETAIPGISSTLIVDRLKEAGKPASYHNMASAQTYLKKTIQADDLIITLGAGDVWRIAAGLVEGDNGSS